MKLLVVLVVEVEVVVGAAKYIKILFNIYFSLIF
jgi:hypothetical protein